MNFDVEWFGWFEWFVVVVVVVVVAVVDADVVLCVGIFDFVEFLPGCKKKKRNGIERKKFF